MKNLLSFTLILAVPAMAFAADEKEDTKPQKKVEQKTRSVKVKDLVLKVPETWKTAPNASSMRLATFTIPSADGDKDKGELTIFSFGGGGGGVSDNIARWRSQFGSEGRKDTVVKGSAGDNEYVLADISGTFNKPEGPPVLRKTKAAPGYRMMGVILVVKEAQKVYFLKLTGPDKTIKAQAKSFRKAFGGSATSEKPLED